MSGSLVSYIDTEAEHNLSGLSIGLRTSTNLQQLFVSN